MLRNILLTAVLLSTFCIARAQTTVNGSFVHEGLTRTYSFYVPASYTQGQAVPLILNLHGYTSTGAAQAIYGDFRPIADTAGFIVVHPDGTPDPISGLLFWNFGIFGTTVNDVGFLEDLIDTVSAHYTIDPERVYCTGMSNGGFMTYAMACESDRFAAVGSVTGSMSVTMYNSCNPDHPTPAIHVHGTDDPTNPYTGNSTSESIPDVVDFWVANNSCNTTPAISNVPDIDNTDGTTSEWYVYSGGVNGHTVEHFKVTGGGHTWPGSVIDLSGSGNTSHDFSASKEIWRFFSQYTRSDLAATPTLNEDQLHLWPNPANNVLYIDADGKEINAVRVVDMQGRTVQQQSGGAPLDLSTVQPGQYLVSISGTDFRVVRKVVVAGSN